MSDHKEHQALPRTPIKVGIVAGLAELACVLFVHSSHRAAVAVVSGQTTGDLELGWLVVLAQMASVLVLPPVILASAFALTRWLTRRVTSRCILHVVANRPFQSRRAIR